MTAVTRPYILALGDSLTAGYGLAPNDAFPAQLQKLLRRHHAGALVQNGGVSGDTSATALARLPRLLSSLTALPDLAIVELGSNDVLRGLPLQSTRANLDAIVGELRHCGIPVLIAALEAPRFLGQIALACDAVYADVAAKHGVATCSFYPRGVLGNRALTLPDGLHPNARAIEMTAANLLPAVMSALRAGMERETGAAA